MVGRWPADHWPGFETHKRGSIAHSVPLLTSFQPCRPLYVFNEIYAAVYCIFEITETLLKGILFHHDH